MKLKVSRSFLFLKILVRISILFFSKVHCQSVATSLLSYKYQDRSLMDTSPEYPDTLQVNYLIEYCQFFFFLILKNFFKMYKY